MNYKNCYFVLLAVLVLMTAGCDELLSGNGSNTVVLDLAAVVKATGQDDVIKKKMEEAKAEVSKQLKGSAGNMDKQLKDERAKLGKTLTKKEEEKFQQMALQANQQLRQMQLLAKQKIQQYESGLILELRKKIKPVAEEIAHKRRASLVRVMNPSVLWFDASIDITDEVIAELRARPAVFDSAPAGKTSEDQTSEDSAAPQAAPADIPTEQPAETISEEMPAGSAVDKVQDKIISDKEK